MPLTLRVLVVDHWPCREPELAGSVDPISENGRGLRVVATLAYRWGWHLTGFEEKQVWRSFALAPQVASG
ncbi:ATP-binding protein [Streptomyces lasiicapitis]|uniref:hypothetical protein n=1 Tax=Streptomyces lasiicapitis TaxID=1923961 RepID=UPI003647713F